MDSINERVHAQLVELANAYFAEIVRLNDGELFSGKYTASQLAKRDKNPMRNYYLIPTDEKYNENITVSVESFSMTFPHCRIFEVLARWERVIPMGKLKSSFVVGEIHVMKAKVFAPIDGDYNHPGKWVKSKRIENLCGEWWIDCAYHKHNRESWDIYACVDGEFYSVGSLQDTHLCTIYSINNIKSKLTDGILTPIKALMQKCKNCHNYSENGYYKSVISELGEKGMQRLAELADMERTTIESNAQVETTETAAPDEVPTAESNTETPTTESDVTTDDTPTETETKEETSTTEFEPMTESEIIEIWNESFDAEIPPTHRVNVVCKGFESSAPAWGERMAESVAYYSRLKYPDGVVTIEVATIATTERTHESPPPTTAETPPTKETPLKRAEIRQFSQIRQKWINSTPLTVATPYGNLKRVYLSHFATAPPLPRKYHRQRWRAATASGDSDCARTLSCASHHPNHFASANSPPNYFCNSKIK